MSERKLNNLYQRLMIINQEAFADEQYEVAYHALAAALHCAQSLNDKQRLGSVERVAKEQLQWIDDHCPESRYSTQSSSNYKRPNIYNNLARQAKIMVLIVQQGKNSQSQA